MYKYREQKINPFDSFTCEESSGDAPIVFRSTKP